MPKKASESNKPKDTPTAEPLEPADSQTPAAASKPENRLKPIDIVAIVVVIVIVTVLGWTIYSKISLKHDVSAAQEVSDKAIAALQKRDGTAAYKLGTPSFQKQYPSDVLTKQFRAVEIATLKPPALVNTTVYTGKDGRGVYFVYKYSALKVPYYTRTIILKQNDTWKLIDISGSADESKLLVTQ